MLPTKTRLRNVQDDSGFASGGQSLSTQHDVEFASRSDRISPGTKRQRGHCNARVKTAHARIHSGKTGRVIRSDDEESHPISGREGSAVIASYLPAEVDMVARLGFVIYAAASIAGAVALLVGIVLFVLGNTPGQALGVRIALAGMLAIGFGRAVHFILADV
jgi:hypothetical protein